MPGYDRTGPLGAGPRTGGGWGLCGRPSDETTPMAGPYRGYGVGRGGRPWGGGRGRCFGGGRGDRWAMADPTGVVATAPQQETFLARQMEALTAALDRVKELLSKHSPEEEEQRE